MTTRSLHENEFLQLTKAMSKHVKRDFSICKDCVVKTSYKLSNLYFAVHFNYIVYQHDEIAELHKFEFCIDTHPVFVFYTTDDPFS